MKFSEHMGRVNYEGYCNAVGGKTWDGKDCPTWEALTDKIRGGWIAGAKASSALSALLIDL